MPNFTQTVIHNLKLSPIEDITFIADFGDYAELALLKEPLNANAVPGSITADSSNDAGVVNKVIEFKRSPLAPETSAELTRLRDALLIALYTDENGNHRLCGSRSFPLRLTFDTNGGVYNIRLTGKSTGYDPFVYVL